MTVPELQTQAPDLDTIEHLDQELAHLAFTVEAIDRLVQDADDQERTADELADVLRQTRDIKGQLTDAISSLERLVGDRMTGFQQTVEGVGTLERHKDVSRRNWQSDDLLRVVLDSDRRVKSADEGEIESDLDVLKDVYGLKGYNARIGGLKDRGIDPDEYCDSEPRGWKVQVR